MEIPWETIIKIQPVNCSLNSAYSMMIRCTGTYHRRKVVKLPGKVIEGVKQGVQANVMPLVIVLIISAGVIIGFIVMKKKQAKEGE